MSGRHAAPSKSTRALAIVGAGALAAPGLVAVTAGAADAQGTTPVPERPQLEAHVSQAAPHVVSRARVAATKITVAVGDTLSGLAGSRCGNPGQWPGLYAANKATVGADPNEIDPGEVLTVVCTNAPAPVLKVAAPAPSRPASTSAGTAPAQVAATVTSASGIYSCADLESLWERVGGAVSEALMAAEIAKAESGGNPNAISPTDDFGLWQINGSHGPAMASLDPTANARAAVAISNDGENWGAWTTFTSGAYAGKC